MACKVFEYMRHDFGLDSVAVAAMIKVGVGAPTALEIAHPRSFLKSGHIFPTPAYGFSCRTTDLMETFPL
eukprot:scaffold449181_cov37-Prasinocladus_malaysianus.AAC.1